MVGTTYVSDPRVWKSFYQNMIDGKFHPGYYRGRQSGGGIANMYAKKPYMVPVNRHVTIEPEPKIVVGKEVSPTAAAEDRARSEFKEAIQDGAPHVPLTIKGSKSKHSFSSQPAAKRSSSLNSQKKKGYKKGPIYKAQKGNPSDKETKRGNPWSKEKAQKREYSELKQTEDNDNVFSKKCRS